MSPHRVILTGVLAVQFGLVTRRQMIDAMRIWATDKTHSVAGILRQSGALDSDGQSLLRQLVEWSLRPHAGDAEKCLAALSSIRELSRDFEELDDPEIKAGLEQAVTLSFAGGHNSPAGEGNAATPFAGDARFRILRPHAKGGLGQVSVALDQELNRQVALKEIQSQYSDLAESRARFVLEAQITGGLEHPGIVPVYGMGCFR